MRNFLTSMCVAAVLAVLVSPALASDATLVGGMAGFNYLLGGPWNCTTAVPAMAGQPARTDHVVLTFDVAPNNVAHDHVAGASYMGDDYYGFNADDNTYWSASADALGNHGSAASKDGKTYTGTSALGSVTINVTSTYSKVNANTATMHEVLSANGQQITIDSTCTR